MALANSIKGSGEVEEDENADMACVSSLQQVLYYFNQGKLLLQLELSVGSIKYSLIGWTYKVA